MIIEALCAVVGFAAGYAAHYFSKGQTKANIEKQLEEIKQRLDAQKQQQL